MKRGRGLNRESEKHRAYRIELMEATPKVIARAKGICEICGHQRVEVIHHRLRRSQGGGNDLGNLLGLCRGCHTEVHENPAWAKEMGYLVAPGVVDMVTNRVYPGYEEEPCSD